MGEMKQDGSFELRTSIMLDRCLILVLCLSLVQSNPVDLPPQTEPEAINQKEVEDNVKRVPRHDEHLRIASDDILTSYPSVEAKPKTLGHDLSGLHPRPTPAPSSSTVINYNVQPSTYTQVQPATYTQAQPAKPQVQYLCPHQDTAHVHSYTTTVPYISGYRLIPIISRKQIILNDPVSYSPEAGSTLPHLSTHTVAVSPPPGTTSESETTVGQSCPTFIPDHIPWTGSDYGYIPGGIPYTQHRSSDPEAILHSFEKSGFFSQNIPESGLLNPVYYENKIETMRNYIEHMESMKDAAQEAN